jgi:hypothetical protein
MTECTGYPVPVAPDRQGRPPQCSQTTARSGSTGRPGRRPRRLRRRGRVPEPPGVRRRGTRAKPRGAAGAEPSRRRARRVDPMPVEGRDDGNRANQRMCIPLAGSSASRPGLADRAARNSSASLSCARRRARSVAAISAFRRACMRDSASRARAPRRSRSRGCNGRGRLIVDSVDGKLGRRIPSVRRVRGSAKGSGGLGAWSDRGARGNLDCVSELGGRLVRPGLCLLPPQGSTQVRLKSKEPEAQMLV